MGVGVGVGVGVSVGVSVGVGRHTLTNLLGSHLGGLGEGSLCGGGGGGGGVAHGEYAAEGLLWWVW